MKFRSIISCGLLLLGVGAATTSCEDMFTAKNNLVTTDLAPKDTVYQMMGIVQRMQKLADRTVLLGEVRADLVKVDPTVASTHVQQLYNNEIDANNIYNKPSDYYSVINSCNIYLANVDSVLKTHGEVYYEKEICAAKCFRAWCYLELAKIYGQVPFVTEPVLTADAAEEIVSSGRKVNMSQILDFCINDIAPYSDMNKNGELRPKYGTQSWNGITYDNMFIPVRALLAELYLWRGTCTNSTDDYLKAAGMYHDYFCFPKEEHGVNDNTVIWLDRDHRATLDAYSSMRFSLAKSSISRDMLEEQVGVIPCDTVEYYGNTSDLRLVFNSQYANNYYPWVTPSQRIKDISAGQTYVYYDYVNATLQDSIVMTHSANDYKSPTEVGDLRLSRVYRSESNLSQSKYNSNLNGVKSTIVKWAGGSFSLSTDVKNAYVPYFRTTILYLHLAEALNRAGLPETAFAILSRGLAYSTLNDRSVISEEEFDKLCEIKSRGFNIQETKYNENPEMLGKTTGTFAVWPSTVFDVQEKNTPKNTLGGYSRPSGSEASLTQVGIHSIGSGDTEFNKYYFLDDAETVSKLIPTVEVPDTVTLNKKSTAEDSIAWRISVEARDLAIETNIEIEKKNKEYLHSAEVIAKRQAHVAKLILDEEALEGMFEGQRFYDIMRYQMQENKGVLSPTITLPSYITTKYPTFNGSAPWVDNMSGKPWYLPLPTR